MLSPENNWECAPPKKFAEAPLEKPGMYLIALRAHLNKGKTIIGDVFESVAEAFPRPEKVQSAADSY